MATIPKVPEEIEDNFELELHRTRNKITTTFSHLTECMKKRENQLLKELDDVIASYRSYKEETQQLNERKMAIGRTVSFHQSELLKSPIKSIHENVMTHLNTELKSIQMPGEPVMVNFVCETTPWLAKVDKLGQLVEVVTAQIDYRDKTQPVLSVCQRGKSADNLNAPHGVSIDISTGNIYISDQYNNCVKVFDRSGKYSFAFGEGDMSLPTGIVIAGNSVIVSQSHNCILVYTLDGKFVMRVGAPGKGELEFNFPLGVAVDESNGDVFICDYCNNRVQVLSKDFRFKLQFGSGVLKRPRDLELFENKIFVLDESSPCLHIFNSGLVLQKSVIPRGRGMVAMFPYYFCIDKFSNVLVTDRNSNCILVFNGHNYELIHKIPVSQFPSGVTLGIQNRIVVTCQANTGCLQIF